MTSQCISFDVFGSVFTIRVADRVTEGIGSRMSDGYTPRSDGSPLAYKLFASCLLLIIDENIARLVYPDTVVILEV